MESTTLGQVVQSNRRPSPKSCQISIACFLRGIPSLGPGFCKGCLLLVLFSIEQRLSQRHTLVLDVIPQAKIQPVPEDVGRHRILQRCQREKTGPLMPYAFKIGNAARLT